MDDWLAKRRNKIVLYWNPNNLVLNSMELMWETNYNPFLDYVILFLGCLAWRMPILYPYLINQVLWFWKYIRSGHKELTGRINGTVVGKNKNENKNKKLVNALGTFYFWFISGLSVCVDFIYLCWFSFPSSPPFFFNNLLSEKDFIFLALFLS